MKAWFLSSILAALIVGVALGHYGAPKCSECPPTMTPKEVVQLEAVVSKERKPSGEHLVAEAVNEVFEQGVKDDAFKRWKKGDQWKRQPGESDALFAWHQANLHWIECVQPKAYWCDKERPMWEYEKWQLEHPRPEK